MGSRLRVKLFIAATAANNVPSVMCSVPMAVASRIGVQVSKSVSPELGVWVPNQTKTAGAVISLAAVPAAGYAIMALIGASATTLSAW